MTNEELFDRFVAHGVTTAEIAPMDPADLTRQIAQMRGDEPDSLHMTSAEIAARILHYAQQQAAPF